MSTEDTSAYGCFTRACMKWSEQRGSRRSSSDACGIDSKRQRTSRRQSCTHYTCEQRRTKLESAWPGEQAPGSASRRYSSSSRAGTAHGACQRPPFAFARTREKAMARESGLRSLGVFNYEKVKILLRLPMYLRSFLKSNLFTYRRTPRGLIGNTKESPSPDSRKRDLIFCFGKV